MPHLLGGVPHLLLFVCLFGGRGALSTPANIYIPLERRKGCVPHLLLFVCLFVWGEGGSINPC